MGERPRAESGSDDVTKGQSRATNNEEAADVYQHLQPQNDFERRIVNWRKRLTSVKDRITGKKQEEEKSPEERKLLDLAQVIQTYREVDDEPIDDEDKSKVVWVDRSEFDIFISFVIFLNSIVIGLEVDLGDDFKRQIYWVLIEIAFLVIFFLEVLFKMLAHGWKWPLMSMWNAFTVFVCVTAFVDAVILQIMGLHGNLRMIALIRVISILRLLRVIRSLKGLKELKLILQGLTGSMAMLFWTVVMLVVFLYVGAAFATSGIGHASVFRDFQKLTGGDDGWDVDAYFGTVGRSMYTLLQCVTRDGWMSTIGRYVVVNQWYMAFFFIGFNLVACYGLLNLVVSVIIEQTLTAARSNEKRVAMREDRARKTELDALQEIFLLSDTDGSGMLDVDEFAEALKMDDIRQRFMRLEIPIDDAKKLFTTVDDQGNRPLTMAEFIDGCTKLKGPAKSRDLLAITSQGESLMKKLDVMGERLHDMEKMMGHLDEISLRITQRFGPSVTNSQHRIVKQNAGLAPVKPLPPEKTSSIGTTLSRGNRPLLPELPKFVS